MINYKNFVLSLLLVFMLMFLAGGSEALAKSDYKSDYKIVDSCDEYMYGPKSHRGFCECYDDPYYYCAYFPDLPAPRANINNTSVYNTIQFFGR